MYIKKLELLNFQVIKEFNADFEGNVYFITGDNELGKSTLLKAIGALLTGERDAVLRKGEEKGFAKMVVGDSGKEYEVSLKFTKANPRGVLSIKGDKMQSSNVSMLQELFGYQNFDAVEFCSWSETADGRRKQIEVVKSLLPQKVQDRINEIDADVKAKKAERTDLNRDIKLLSAQVKASKQGLATGDEKKYTTRMDVSDLLKVQQKQAENDAKATLVRSKLQERVDQLAAIPQKIEGAKAKYEQTKAAIEDELRIAQERFNQLKAELDKRNTMAFEEFENAQKEISAEKADAEERKANCESWLKDYESTIRTAADTDAIAQAQAHNEKVAIVEGYLARKAELDKVQATFDNLGGEVEKLQTERAEIIENANLPISGLSFTEDGLTLNNMPFMDGVVSDSQKMEVAAKLIIAANPTVKVFRIARGESLGAKRLKTILDVAKANGFQGFIENVKRGQETMQVEEYTEN